MVNIAHQVEHTRLQKLETPRLSPTTTPQEQSKSARLGAERRASSDTNENWRAEPSCFDQATGMVGRAPVSRTWVLMSPDGLYRAYAVNEAVATRSVDGEISGCRSMSKLFVTGPAREGRGGFGDGAFGGRLRKQH